MLQSRPNAVAVTQAMEALIPRLGLRILLKTVALVAIGSAQDEEAQ